MLRFTPLLLCSGLLFGAWAEVNNYPIVGIFTQPSDSSHGECGGDCLMLAASYVKQVESTGARVVPINYYATEGEITSLFHSLNGFIFPGGGAGLPPAAQTVYDLTIAANDNGDFMPLWGTCLGFEWLLMCTSGDENILDPDRGQCDSFNLSLPLEFTDAARGSRLFGDALPLGLYEVLATRNVTFNSHHEGIYPQHFAATDSLSAFYSVLSTNKDRKGKPFVSTIEANQYPIYGVQWHPEKNRYELDMVNGMPFEAIPHTMDAVFVSQYMANYFGALVRKSSHTFSSAMGEDSCLIDNYRTTKTGPMFMETYFFSTGFKCGSL